MERHGTGKGKGGNGGRGRGRGRNQENPNYPSQQRNYRPVASQYEGLGQVPMSGSGQFRESWRPNPGPGNSNVGSGEGTWRNQPSHGQNPNYPTQQRTYRPVSSQDEDFGQVPISGSGQFGRHIRPNPEPGHRNVGSGEGTSRDPRQGRRKEMVYVPVKQPASGTDSLVPEVQKLEISQPSPSSPPKGRERSPVERPDNGGKSALRRFRLLVNHFLVKFNPQLTIFQYDISIKSDMPLKDGRTGQISKSDMRMIKNKLFSDDPVRFPSSMTAYDGEKNIFSAVELATGDFKVEVSRGDDCRTRTYIITIKLAAERVLCNLDAYLKGTLLSIPREILQGMDLVMKEYPTRHRIPIGRSFYSKEFKREDDLGRGIIASKGFQHSLKPTSQGLALCVDYSVLAFRKQVSVLEFLREHIPQFRVSHLDNWMRKEVEKALKGLRVTVTHRPTKQKYIIKGLTNSVTNSLSFQVEDTDGNYPRRRVGVVGYFRDKYKKEIMYKNLPCLDLSKNEKMNYVPMEFCVLVEGQRYPKEELDKDRDAARKFKDRALAKPWKRMEVICDMVQAMDGPCGGEIAQNFEIAVSTKMTEVTGRVIGPPLLRIGDANGKSFKFTLKKQDCQWNLVDKSVLEGKRIERWGIIDFCDGRAHLDPERFIEQLLPRFDRLGIYMENPLFCKQSNMHVLSNVDQLRHILNDAYNYPNQIGGGQLQILICVMTKKDPGYKNLKRICETEIGIVTQCCLCHHANEGKDQYLANLALKINAKLGGSNVELFERLPRLEGDGHVMFVGADVNHPGSWNTTSPSIAAVVATVNWPAANRYAARIRPQDHRTEKIQNFGQMCLELLDAYARINKVKPEKIVVFRDGVSESQFDMVLNEELTDLKRAIESDGYSPTITLVVARKRHQTRLFPKDEKQGAPTGNVFPGTVVDTTIVHPREFDFYLCSHHGSLGTSKPTHYHVLWDEHGFTSDELQRVIYNLCYTFARCTKPVSLVPPVYYADLVAYRGRQYYEAWIESHSPGLTGFSSSSLSPSSSSSSASFDQSAFCKLHRDLENDMFFC